LAHDPPIPHDLNAEMSLLGSMMLKREAIDATLTVLDDSSALIGPGHRKLFDALVALHNTDTPVDLVTVRDYLTKNGIEIDLDYIVRLAESVPSWLNAERYAAIVKTYGQRQRIITIGSQIVQQAYNLPADKTPASLALDASAAFDAIAVGHDANIAETDAALLLEKLAGRLAEGKSYHVTTGVTAIDGTCQGFEKHGLSIIAARPSVGKTALALWMAQRIAFDPAACPVAFFSVEMAAEKIVGRLIAQLSGVTMGDIFAPTDVSIRLRAIAKARELIRRDRLFIIECVSNIQQIVAQARSLIQRKAVGVVIVDYLQLCAPAERLASRNLEVAAMSASLKYLATQTGAAVVALSQLNRGAEVADRRPELHDLRDSGAIEQDADMVILMHREAKQRDRIELAVAKNRNGPVGPVTLFFNEKCMTYGSALAA
jgi:replicative DNA helicase